MKVKGYKFLVWLLSYAAASDVSCSLAYSSAEPTLLDLAILIEDIATDALHSVTGKLQYVHFGEVSPPV